MQIESNSLIQTLSVLSLAVIGLIVGLQKLLKDWRSTGAETNIITMMHTELERMSVQNTKLSSELGKLQEEIIELNNQLTKLSIENNKLQEEVSRLTIELKTLATINTIKE